MIPLQSFIFLFMRCFLQLYDGEFISMKISSFTFFFTFLNEILFKDKTLIMTFSSRSLLKPKAIKKWKEKWN